MDDRLRVVGWMGAPRTAMYVIVNVCTHDAHRHQRSFQLSPARRSNHFTGHHSSVTICLSTFATQHSRHRPSFIPQTDIRYTIYDIRYSARRDGTEWHKAQTTRVVSHKASEHENTPLAFCAGHAYVSRFRSGMPLAFCEGHARRVNLRAARRKTRVRASCFTHRLSRGRRPGDH